MSKDLHNVYILTEGREQEEKINLRRCPRSVPEHGTKQSNTEQRGHGGSADLFGFNCTAWAGVQAEIAL